MAPNNNVTQLDAQACRDFAQGVTDIVAETMYDMTSVTRLSLLALYSNGHVLLEGNPGLGKTDFVKALGSVLGFDNGRIQFTPDLMPSDITGTKLPTENNNVLEFSPGPIFTTLLLADEINRATPKTQSAMLEAMAERRVTVLGEPWNLMPRADARKEVKERANGKKTQDSFKVNARQWPFMVLATQNPIDQEGTYNLPEAQADRFMFKILVTMPRSEGLLKIMKKNAGLVNKHVQTDIYAGLRKAGLLVGDESEPVAAHTRMGDFIKRVDALTEVEEHICNAVLASNGRWDELGGLTNRLPAPEQQRLHKIVEMMPFGLGPRAAYGLLLGSKAWALFYHSGSIPTADARALARVFTPSVRHRLRLEYDWEQGYFELLKSQIEDSASPPQLTTLGITDELIRRISDAAPDGKANVKGRKPPLKPKSKGTPWAALTTLDLFIIDFFMLTAPAPKNYDYRVDAGKEFQLMLTSA